MTASTFDIAASLTTLALGLEEVAALQEAILAIAETEDCPGSLSVMSRMGGRLLEEAVEQQIAIAAWCRAIDMERIEREKLAADIADTDDGQAVRDLARTLAQEIEQTCAPAMRAITVMQSRAGQLDAMIRRARDMAGCLRPVHSPDRDPDKPEVGSLRAEVENVMVARPGSLTAEMERRSREVPRWMRLSVPGDRPL